MTGWQVFLASFLGTFGAIAFMLIINIDERVVLLKKWFDEWIERRPRFIRDRFGRQWRVKK